MPYLPRDRRVALATFPGEPPATSGELNFLLTECCKRYVQAHGLEYRTLNDVLGALEGAKQEFYRRVAAPYEDKKKTANGDVYLALMNELERT